MGNRILALHRNGRRLLLLRMAAFPMSSRPEPSATTQISQKVPPATSLQNTRPALRRHVATARCCFRHVSQFVTERRNSLRRPLTFFDRKTQRSPQTVTSFRDELRNV